MYTSETRLNRGELGPLSETSPDDGSFVGAPRSSGRCGRKGTIFRNSFKCCLLSVDHFSSFEVQLLQISTENAVLCALILSTTYYNFLFMSFFFILSGTFL